MKGRRRSHGLIGAGTGGGGFEEIDTQTQLLINYARVDASSKHHNIGKHISEVLSNVVPHHHHHHHQSRQNTPPPPLTLAATSQQPSTSGIAAAVAAASSSIELKPVNTSRNYLPTPPQLMIEDTSFNSCSSQPPLPNSTEIGQQQQQQQLAASTSIDEDVALARQEQIMRHTLLSILLLNRRRRHSWPRCKQDNLQFNNFNREVRCLLFQHQQGGYNYYHNNSNNTNTNQESNGNQ